jgi:integrase/recombinase XerD
LERIDTVPGRQPRLHPPYAQWPQADRRLWEDAVASDDPFGDSAGARLASATQQVYLNGWRRFLGFLALEELTALEIDPAERLTMPRVRAFAAHLATTNEPQSVAAQVDALYKAARIMMPDRDWGWLKAVKARLYATAPPRGPAGPVITSVQLLELGQQLMDETQPTPLTKMRMADAIQYRDGLMIAMLAFEPLRRRNVAALEISRHLVREGDRWFIIVPPEETKTGTLIEFAVPPFLNPYLATYLEFVRPRMLRCSSNALWASPKGGALSYSAIWDIISRHSERRMGFHLSPHDVRDAAATTWAVAAPDRVGISSDLLGHSDLRTTARLGPARRNMGCDQETVRASREDYPPGRPRPSGLCHANPSSGDLSKR